MNFSSQIKISGFCCAAACAALVAAADENQGIAGGFRDGGSTFGLNFGAFEIAGKTKGVSEGEKLAAFEKAKAEALSSVPRNRDESNKLVRAVEGLFQFRERRGEWKAVDAMAAEFAAKIQGRYPDLENRMLVRQFAARAALGDEPGFEELAKKIDARPADRKTMDFVGNLDGQMRHATSAMRVRLWKRFDDARASMDPQDHMAVLDRASGLFAKDLVQAKARWEEAQKLAASSAAAWEKENAREKAAREVERLARANKLPYEPFKRDPAVKRPADLRGMRNWYVRWLSDHGELKELLPFQLEDAAASRSPDAAFFSAAQTAYKIGDKKACLAALACCTNNAIAPANYSGRRVDTDPHFNLGVLKTLASTSTAGEFGARIPELRGDKDEKAYFDALRQACKFLYGLSSDSEMRDRIRELVRLSFELRWNEERVWYVVKYLEDAPATAEGAYRMELFKQLATENRMARYNVWTWYGCGNESATRSSEYPLLKSNPKPHLEADVPGKEGVFAACYDAKGVHFYAKLNSPDAWKTAAGLEDALYAECSIQTGDEASWHWLLFSALKPENTVPVEWDSPQFGRKMTSDYVKSDVFTGKDCIVVHVFAPWLLAYDRIPSGAGDLWRFVGVFRWAGPLGALGGGAVHELGRGVQLRFDMPAAAEAAVRLGVLRAAAGEYKRFRALWESADFWDDPILGDAPFYAEVVKPYLRELDGAAKEVAALPYDGVDASEVARLSEYLQDFADTRLSLDAKRSAYLKAKLLK